MFGLEEDDSSIPYFNIGSTKKEVLEAQGQPGSISKSEYFNEETWVYDLAGTVEFKNGKVEGFRNHGGLRIRVEAD